MHPPSKVCFKCAQRKPRTEFYKHPMMGDGLLGKCKECTKKDATANRWAKIEKIRAYDRRRASLPHRVALHKETCKRWEAEHPLRSRARVKLRRAILAGKITPYPCQVCGEKAEAHHPDYDQPLDVVWLCTPHHRQAHALVRKAA